VFAVGLLVAYEAGARFIERLLAVGTSQTSHVPLQVWRHSQDVLVQDHILTASTDGRRSTTSYHSDTLTAAAVASFIPQFNHLINQPINHSASVAELFQG